MSAQAVEQSSIVEITLPNCEKGIGNVITSPDSPHLIAGVKAAAYAVWPDDRGFFAEVMRGGKGLVKDFPPETTQVSAAVSYHGTIKAFHFHKHQTDCWMPLRGMFQVALVDLRKESPTFGVRNTFYIGELRPWQLIIPPGVGHGYKIIGEREALLVYVTDRIYNPADEGRIPYNEPRINYDWETQHK